MATFSPFRVRCGLCLALAGGVALWAEPSDTTTAHTPMAVWKNAHFTPAQIDAGLASDLSSPSGDGVSNLMKYAYGVAPFDDASAFGPSTEFADGSLLLQYRQRSGATDLRFAVEISSDLRNWSSSPDLVEEIARDPVGPGVELVTVRDRQAAVGSAQRFLRLSVTRQVTDTTGNGLLDDWQMRHFGRLGVDPAGDPDGDGLPNRAECASGSNPHDCFDGFDLVVKPLLTPAGQLLPGGILRVWVGRSDGHPLRNAAVSFKIVSGHNQILVGESLGVLEVSGTTDEAGVVEVKLIGGGC